ncbi:hypothetical protein [Burkholderia plantarii]|uniref:hypothetical protein n=1 Tax=Burkholderia plantarii TaxID=41899 RepID=UPI0018DDEB57|nr:hypothetical protein [Burkholderia plantarii]MBI0326867.1 hypothetical protein [Burkholderia plantarii]
MVISRHGRYAVRHDARSRHPVLHIKQLAKVIFALLRVFFVEMKYGLERAFLSETSVISGW